jgi:hypothetical protein
MTIAALTLLLAVQGQGATAPKPKPKPAASKPAASRPTAAKPVGAKSAPENGKAAAAAEPALPPSPWSLRENKDPATGVRFSSVSMVGAVGYRLAVRCDLSPDPVISVQLIPPKPFGSIAEKLVTVLPDNAGAIVINWEFVGGGAINRSADVFRIVEAVAAAKQVRLFTTDSAGDPISDGFEAPGGDALFRHVFAFCSTPYEPMTPASAAPPVPVAPVGTPVVAPAIKLGPPPRSPGLKVPPAPPSTGTGASPSAPR